MWEGVLEEVIQIGQEVFFWNWFCNASLLLSSKRQMPGPLIADSSTVRSRLKKLLTILSERGPYISGYGTL